MESYSAQSMYDRRNRTLILFYSNLIKEDNKIDVYEYMRCYYSIGELPEKYRKLHLKALYSAFTVFTLLSVWLKLLLGSTW